VPPRRCLLVLAWRRIVTSCACSTTYRHETAELALKDLVRPFRHRFCILDKSNHWPVWYDFTRKIVPSANTVALTCLNRLLTFGTSLFAIHIYPCGVGWHRRGGLHVKIKGDGEALSVRSRGGQMKLFLPQHGQVLYTFAHVSRLQTKIGEETQVIHPASLPISQQRVLSTTLGLFSLEAKFWSG
jgi:hypothetical protein